MSGSFEIIESSGTLMPQGEFVSELGRELYRKLFSFPPGDPRADEWIQSLTKAECDAFMAEIDRELKQAEVDNLASEPRRYYSYIRNMSGVDLDATAWEYGVTDGNFDEVRMRQKQERQAQYFQTSHLTGAPRDVKVFHMRSSKGH